MTDRWAGIGGGGEEMGEEDGPEVRDAIALDAVEHLLEVELLYDHDGGLYPAGQYTLIQRIVCRLTPIQRLKWSTTTKP